MCVIIGLAQADVTSVNSPQSLLNGERVYSSNGRYEFLVQGDGNGVNYLRIPVCDISVATFDNFLIEKNTAI